jgi:transcriptional regulator with XRE-family HTH domain
MLALQESSGYPAEVETVGKVTARFGDNLKRERERAPVTEAELARRRTDKRPIDRPLTQLELARRMNWKSQSNIASIEKGDLPPKPDVVRKLAEKLGCHPGALMRDVVDPWADLREEPPRAKQDRRAAETFRSVDRSATRKRAR